MHTQKTLLRLAPNLGLRLHELRIARGLSLLDEANALGVTKVAVQHWESGSRFPSLEYLLQMSVLFGVSVNDLVGMPIPTVKAG